MEKEYLNKDEFLAIMDDPKNIDSYIEEFSANHKKAVKKQAARTAKAKKAAKKTTVEKVQEQKETPTQQEIEQKVDEFLKK